MAYQELTPSERAERGRQLADALERFEKEESDQEQAKKAMKARLQILGSEVARLKTEVRSGMEWVDEQGRLDISIEETR